AAVVAFGWGNMRTIAGRLGCDASGHRGHSHKPKSFVDSAVLVPDRGKERDAERIAADIGARVAYMPEGEPDNFDANDYARREGHEALAELLGQAVKVSRESQESQPEPLRK